MAALPQGYDQATEAYLAEEEKWSKREALVKALAVVGGDFGNRRNGHFFWHFRFCWSHRSAYGPPLGRLR